VPAWQPTLFESYEVTLVASIILGVPAFAAIFPHQPQLWRPVRCSRSALARIGVLASSSVCSRCEPPRRQERDGADQPGFLAAGILTTSER